MIAGKRVLICGTNDLASATAVRLFRAGFHVILLAENHPQDLHYQRTFSAAVYAGSAEVEQIHADTMSSLLEKGELGPESSVPDFIHYNLMNRHIPILFQNDIKSNAGISVDAIFISNTHLFDLVPQRISNDAVIIVPADLDLQERGRYQICRDPACLGQVIYPFNRESFADRKNEGPDMSGIEVVHAPLEGVFVSNCTLDGWIHQKQELAKINDIPILSPVTGKITGLLNSGMIIKSGTSFAEISAATTNISAKRISVEAFAVAGGVLEAILFDQSLNQE